MASVEATKNDGGAGAVSEIRVRLGGLLQEARQRAGVSIEAVAQETKISKQFIIYLESGRVEDLPGQVFGRGFVKNIARYLKSDSRELLRLYDDCWSHSASPVSASISEAPVAPKAAQAVVQEDDAPAATPVVPAVMRKTSSLPSTKSLVDTLPRIAGAVKSKRMAIRVPTVVVRFVVSPHARLAALGVVAAVMVIAVLGRWVSAQLSHRTAATVSKPVAVTTAAPTVAERSDPSEAVATMGVVAEPEAAIPSNIVEKEINAVETPAKTSASAVSNANEVAPLSVAGTPVAFDQIIELKVSSPLDVKLTIDGKRVDVNAATPDTYRYTFHQRAEIHLSDASAIDVIYNGKSLGALGTKGRKRRIVFQAKPSDSDFPN